LGGLSPEIFMKHAICASLGAYPAKTCHEAMRLANHSFETLFGKISTSHVQLCPQNFGQLTDAIVDDLMALYPDTRFRLHANARVQERLQIVDLVDWFDRPDFFAALARTSKRLNAPAYSLHAGQRSSLLLAKLFDAAKAAADLFGCPVAIEGHYPTARGKFFLDSWLKYEQLARSGVPFALDLSHIQILAHKSGEVRYDLLCDMVASDRCLEIHLSANDGSGDQHRQLVEPPWWWSLLDMAHADAVLFTEGNQVRH
jgi:hypothetical protein